MFNNTFFLGISGEAPTVGKDFLCHKLSEKLPNSIVRLSFGDFLKQELASYIFKQHNIDVFWCSPKEKEIFRPIIIKYAEEKRKNTNGKYFWKALYNSINIEYDNQNRYLDNKIAVITDIRFAEYKNDELWFLKEKLGGKLIYVRKYILNNGKKEYVSTNIKQELENAPKLKEAADFIVDWEHANEKQCSLLVDKVIRKFKLQNYERKRINAGNKE